MQQCRCTSLSFCSYCSIQTRGLIAFCIFKRERLHIVQIITAARIQNLARIQSHMSLGNGDDARAILWSGFEVVDISGTFVHHSTQQYKELHCCVNQCRVTVLKQLSQNQISWLNTCASCRCTMIECDP